MGRVRIWHGVPTMPDEPVAHVLDSRARLGECPVWDPARQELGWVDVYNHRVHRFDPSTGSDSSFDTGDVVSAMSLVGGVGDGDRLLLALRDRLAFLHLESGRSGEIESLQRLKFTHPGTRLNDGKCDARVRFWVGSMSKEPKQAALYRYDPDGSLHVMETGLTLSNGLGWSPDGTTFYLTDSTERRIYAYRFDAESGSIHDRRVLIDLSGEPVEPDGLAVDRKGHLWVALWDGWCVARFDSQGREVERTPLPVQRPTSLAFGGPDLADLYVTTASIGLSQSEIQRQFLAGDLFRVSAATPGMPPNRFHSEQS